MQCLLLQSEAVLLLKPFKLAALRQRSKCHAKIFDDMLDKTALLIWIALLMCTATVLQTPLSRSSVVPRFLV